MNEQQTSNFKYDINDFLTIEDNTSYAFIIPDGFSVLPVEVQKEKITGKSVSIVHKNNVFQENEKKYARGSNFEKVKPNQNTDDYYFEIPTVKLTRDFNFFVIDGETVVEIVLKNGVVYDANNTPLSYKNRIETGSILIDKDDVTINTQEGKHTFKISYYYDAIEKDKFPFYFVKSQSTTTVATTTAGRKNKNISRKRKPKKISRRRKNKRAKKTRKTKK
jgi:hypothetical protein